MLKKTISLMCILPFLLPITLNTHSSFKSTMAKVDKVIIETNLSTIEKGILPYEKQYKINMLNEIGQGLVVQQQERMKADERQRESEREYIDFTLTFYTTVECGGNIDCMGRKLTFMCVASNVYKNGTMIELGQFGTLEVRDKGGSNFSSPFRLDVFLPRLQGESDYQYQKRARDLGRVKVKGRVVK